MEWNRLQGTSFALILKNSIKHISSEIIGVNGYQCLQFFELQQEIPSLPPKYSLHSLLSVCVCVFYWSVM